MKKVAIPVDNGILCSVFENCSQFKIVTIEGDSISNDITIPVVRHQTGFFPFWLSADGVTDVIVNRISRETVNKLNGLKINVFVGVETKDSSTIITEFIDGNIEINPELCDN